MLSAFFQWSLAGKKENSVLFEFGRKGFAGGVVRLNMAGRNNPIGASNRFAAKDDDRAYRHRWNKLIRKDEAAVFRRPIRGSMNDSEQGNSIFGFQIINQQNDQICGEN